MYREMQLDAHACKRQHCWHTWDVDHLELSDMVGSSLQMMGTTAAASAAGKAKMQALHGLLSSREPVWRDLKRLQEAASLALLLQKQ